MTAALADDRREHAIGRADQRADLLFALFQGGGNLALILPVVEAAVERGHTVRVLAGPGVWSSRMPLSDSLQQRVERAGGTALPFAMPDIHPFDASPPARGLLHGWTPSFVRRATWYITPNRWIGAWAANVAAELRRQPASVVVADFLLPGALVAAEALQVPSISLIHGIYKHRRAVGLPPYGSGLTRARGPLGRTRDALWTFATERIYARDGLPSLNAARSTFGLPRLASPGEQHDLAARVLVLTERAFDFDVRPLPSNVRYVGSPINPGGVADWTFPWPKCDERPLVLVSLSTLPQGQEPVLRRILAAVATMPVRVLVTLGPALNAAQFHGAENTAMLPFVPHQAVLPYAEVMITQCGIGGVIAALRAGVPLVCIPLVGDQPDNAARIVSHGAGVRLGSEATPERIRRAILQVLRQPRFREQARRVGAKMLSEQAAQQAVRECEWVAASAGPRASGPADRQTTRSKEKRCSTPHR
jgi:MGT family glycosyltransferase